MTDPIPNDNIPHLYTVQEASDFLRISTKTLHRYINLSQVNCLVLNPHGKRLHVRFSQQNLADFISAHSGGVKPEERPKRAYHRTKRKYARTKKKAPGKKGKKIA